MHVLRPHTRADVADGEDEGGIGTTALDGVDGACVCIVRGRETRAGGLSFAGAADEEAFLSADDEAVGLGGREEGRCEEKEVMCREEYNRVSEKRRNEEREREEERQTPK